MLNCLATPAAQRWLCRCGCCRLPCGLRQGHRSVGQGQRRGQWSGGPAHPLAGGRLRQVRGPGKAPGQHLRWHHHGPAQLRRGPGEIWKLEGTASTSSSASARKCWAIRPSSLRSTATPAWPVPAVMGICSRPRWCPALAARPAVMRSALPVSATGVVHPCGAAAIWKNEALSVNADALPPLPEGGKCNSGRENKFRRCCPFRCDGSPLGETGGWLESLRG